MKPSIRPLAIITISIFGFLVILTQYANKSNFEMTAKDMHVQVIQSNYVLNDTVVSKLSDALLIDIREPHKYLISHRKEAINLPLANILNEENQTFWQKNHPKVLQSDDPIKAHEAWMLLTQLGVKDLYILQ